MILNLFNGFTDTVPTCTTLDEVVALIRSDKKLQLCTLRHRELLNRQGGNAACSREKRSAPCIAVAVLFNGGKKRTDITGWTGLSLVDIDHVEEQEIPALMELIRTDSHTLLAYTTISGKGVRVLYRWQLPEEDSMESEQPYCAANIDRYTQAFLTGNDYYEKLVGVKPDGQCKNATRLCGLAHDPEVYYNPEAVPFEVMRRKRAKGKNGKSVALTRVLSAVKKELQKTGIAYVPGHHNEYISRMGYLMNLYGVALEELTAWAVEEFADYDGDVRAILRSCYTHTSDFHTRRLPRKKEADDDRPTYPTVQQMEEYLNTQAAFRYNVITGKCEYCPLLPLPERETSVNTAFRDSSHSIGVRGDFLPLDNRFIHTLWKGLASQYKLVRVQDVHQLLMSTFVPEFNPFEAYVATLPAWDGTTDYIAQVAATVTTVPDGELTDDITFEWAFRKWIVGVVAGLFDRDRVNEEILVLVGRQGTYKTTWLARLLPPELRSYFRIKTDSDRFDKDDRLALAEFALICLEELEVMRPSELNQLKSLVTNRHINERPAYARYKEERTHIASFCGTSNNLQFLSDPSGERRWLPFEVAKIASPHDTVLPYEGLYAQALHLWREGFPYWFEGEEIERINRHALRFQVPDLLHDLIHTHYRVPMPGEAAVFVTTADIVTNIGYALRTPPALPHIGRLMKEAGYTSIRHGNRRGYIVVRLDRDHMEAARRVRVEKS